MVVITTGSKASPPYKLQLLTKKKTLVGVRQKPLPDRPAAEKLLPELKEENAFSLIITSSSSLPLILLLAHSHLAGWLLDDRQLAN